MIGHAAPDRPALEPYWRRKERELAFLRSFADIPSDDRPILSVPAYLDAARELRRGIRIRQVAMSSDLFETSLQGAHAYEGPFGTVSYSYQRYDLARTGIDWLSEVYARPAQGRAAGGMYFSSGISAIAAVLLHITGRGYRRISISPMAYFETHDLCRRFFGQLELRTAGATLSSGADVIWLDTSSTVWSRPPGRSTRVRMMVVDTSCVEAGGAPIDDWLRAAERLGCPLLLVRSHLKLDTFGIELGRLGSVVVVAPEIEGEDLERLLLDLRHARSGFGLGFELPNLYPWLGRPEFVELSSLRTDGIRAATDALAMAVEDARVAGVDAFEIVRGDHRLFFHVKTGIVFPDEEAAKGGRVSRAVASRCARDGLPTVAASSFGLDRFAFMDFVNLHDGLHYLRVAGADLPLDGVALVARHIRDTIAEWPRQP